MTSRLQNIRQNRDGVSGAVLVLIIVVLLVGYQFLAPFLGWPSFTQLIDQGVNEETPENIFMDIAIINLQTGTVYPLVDDLGDTQIGPPDGMDGLDVEDQAGDTPDYDESGLRIQIQTNAPSIVFGQAWRINADMEHHNTFGNDFFLLIDEEIDFEGQGTKTFNIDIEHTGFTTYNSLIFDFDWNEIEITLFDDSGDPFIFQEFFLAVES